VKTVHKYGMRKCGFSPEAAPKTGFIEREDDLLGDYWDVLIYDRMLTVEDEKYYGLDYLGSRRVAE